MKTFKTTMAFLTAMTMTVGATGITTAYAKENEPMMAEQQVNIESVKGNFQSGATYTCNKDGLFRIHGSIFTADEFYQIVSENAPKYLVIVQSDISGNDSEVNEWFKQVTNGELGIEAVAVVTNGENSLLDKYNKMIDGLLNEANDENITATDLKFKYKLFFYDKLTAEFSGPDGVICENCHYVDMREMEAYPDNIGILAAENATDILTYNEEDYVESDTLMGEVTILAKTENVKLQGDANGDGTLNIRDCAMISRSLINGTADDLPDTADYNKDGIKNIRDGAAIAKVIAQNKN